MLGYEPSHRVGSRCHIQVSYSRGPCDPCPAISTRAEIAELIDGDGANEAARRQWRNEQMGSLMGRVARDDCRPCPCRLQKASACVLGRRSTCAHSSSLHFSSRSMHLWNRLQARKAWEKGRWALLLFFDFRTLHTYETLFAQQFEHEGYCNTISLFIRCLEDTLHRAPTRILETNSVSLGWTLRCCCFGFDGQLLNPVELFTCWICVYSHGPGYYTGWKTS
jgi:hypothetical protein